jgi:uncharacterized protein
MEILPIYAKAQTWGDEVYFEVPMSVEKEPDAQQVVDPGTLGFWVEGNCVAIPFGPTPISQGDECRLAGRVNILGKVHGEAKVLNAIHEGESITVSSL